MHIFVRALFCIQHMQCATTQCKAVKTCLAARRVDLHNRINLDSTLNGKAGVHVRFHYLGRGGLSELDLVGCWHHRQIQDRLPLVPLVAGETFDLIVI